MVASTIVETDAAIGVDADAGRVANMVAEAAAVEAAAASRASSRRSSRRRSSQPARRAAGSIPRATPASFADPPTAISPKPGDAYVPPFLVRQFALRRADLDRRHDRASTSAAGRRSSRSRAINENDPAHGVARPEFNSLPASYPERKLFMETGRPAKGGPELTRRAIDLIAPIGYGQRALIVAPARAGKTTLLHAITEGVAINHPNAALLILLVDERPEEVSEAISWGVGEVIASSFDQPAQRHVEVTEMVLERARRLVEGGQGRRDRARFAHAHGARAQHRGARNRPHAVGRSRCHGDGEAKGVLRVGPLDSRTRPAAARSRSSRRRSWRRARGWTT